MRRPGWFIYRMVTVLRTGWTAGWKQIMHCSRWMSGRLRWLGYSLAIAISVLQQFSSLLSVYLCQSEKTQVGCLSTCVFVTVSNSSILQLQGPYYYCTLSSTKDVIADEVTTWILVYKERVILTSCASSHLSLFSSINRLLTDCTKFWKTKRKCAWYILFLCAVALHCCPKNN